MAQQEQRRWLAASCTHYLTPLVDASLHQGGPSDGELMRSSTLWGGSQDAQGSKAHEGHLTSAELPDP